MLLTQQQFDAMLKRQNHCCACCGTTKPGGKSGRFIIDHCHVTGRARGLLCHKCNVGIGLLGDCLAGVVKAAEYLARTENRNVKPVRVGLMAPEGRKYIQMIYRDRRGRQVTRSTKQTVMSKARRVAAAWEYQLNGGFVPRS